MPVWPGSFSSTVNSPANNGAAAGDPVADFLLGLPQDVQQGNGGGGNKYLRNSLFGIFAQDNWRIKDNLTLNLGLRYELTTARQTNNGQDVNFDLITGKPTIGVRIQHLQRYRQLPAASWPGLAAALGTRSGQGIP